MKTFTVDGEKDPWSQKVTREDDGHSTTGVPRLQIDTRPVLPHSKEVGPKSIMERSTMVSYNENEVSEFDKTFPLLVKVKNGC